MKGVRAFTLPELMVSLYLASLLILLASTVYLQHKKLFSLSQQILEYNDTQRFIHHYLQEQIWRAGFQVDPSVNRWQLFKADAKQQFSAGQIIQSATSNSLRLRYQPMYPNQFSCIGHNINNSAFTPKAAALLPVVTSHLHWDKRRQVLRCNGHAILEKIADLEFSFSVLNTQGQMEKVAAQQLGQQSVLAVHYQIQLVDTSINQGRVQGSISLKNASWLASK